MTSNKQGRAWRWIAGLVVIGAMAAWLIYNWYRPGTLVDVSSVTRGPMDVTVQEDGKTRIKDRYVVSSPLMGNLVRIELDPGDIVRAKETVVATIRPTEPALLDQRQKMQSEARVKAAELAVEQARSQQSQVKSNLDLAEQTFGRLSKLGNTVSQQDLSEVETKYRTELQSHSVAKLATQIAEFELQQAQAALLHVTSDQAGDGHDQTPDFVVHAPIDGKVLRVLQESAAVVQPGTALLELGDPANLEVEIDVLSSQAVRIMPGNKIVFNHWGGEGPLHGIVSRVEPAGFTKISALGVEEQRVNVIADLIEPPGQRPTLGDSYRVEAEVAIWHGENIVQVATSALFRTQSDWSVFVVEAGALELRRIEIGHRNRQFAEVLSGLSESDQVVLHPTDQLQSGLRVSIR